jgi:hypothetical protein
MSEVEFRLIGPDDHIIAGRPSSLADDRFRGVSERSEFQKFVCVCVKRRKRRTDDGYVLH